MRNNHLRKKYGMTPDDLIALWSKQSGLCALCDEPMLQYGGKGNRRAVIDHNHDTGRVRGLLHDWCNRILGLFGDDPRRLEQAAEYLRAGLTPG